MRRFWKLKKWPLCKGYRLCKMVSFRKKIKLPKRFGKRLYKHIRVFLCKKRMEETANNGKMRRFWKLKKWPLCKGYSLCKMVSFRQKIKLPKTCGKRLYKHITVVLWKKRMEETANNEEMRRFWKLEKWPLCKGKMVSAFAKWSVLVKKKIARKMRKAPLQAHYSCSVQKTDGRNRQYSKNETILKIGRMATVERL